MNPKVKMSNARKNAAYPITPNYIAWQYACREAMPGCTFKADCANHRYAHPATPHEYAHGHFWLNTDRGVVVDDDGNTLFSQHQNKA